MLSTSEAKRWFGFRFRGFRNYPDRESGTVQGMLGEACSKALDYCSVTGTIVS